MHTTASLLTLAISRRVFIMRDAKSCLALFLHFEYCIELVVHICLPDHCRQIVTGVKVMLFEKPWEHATVDGQPHNHGTTPLLSFLLLVLLTSSHEHIPA
jgi:hypothetical protein